MKPEVKFEERVEAIGSIVNFCHEHLFAPDSKKVLSYLKNERGLSDETIRKFKIGAFPRYPDIVSNLVGSFIAWKLGIIGFSKDGYVLSKFSTHKVIIPIYDSANNPIAIMGRSLLPSEELDKRGLPKYINSYYKKSSNLFGLNITKDYIRKENQLIIVEGNFDVITAVQNNLNNVVATSHASLSRMQFLLATRYATNLVVAFDNDNAGREGVERVIRNYDGIHGISLSQLNMPPDVKDLDEYFSFGRKYSELVY